MQFFFLAIGFICALAVFFEPTRAAYAHVQYVVPASSQESYRDFDLPFLFSVFQDPYSIAVIGSSLVAAILFVSIAKRSILFLREVTSIRKEAESYVSLIPWMIRLALGIALIGAGSTGTLISPHIIRRPFNFVRDRRGARKY